MNELKIIGITGTNGKTTTTNIIAHILKNLGKKVAVSGTEGIFLHSQNNVEKIMERGNTTPDIFSTLINLREAKKNGAEFFVMEVSSHGIFQKRIEGLKFVAKIFTNLTQDHLDFHKTFENYCEVKSSFFSDGESLKIINFDDENIKYNKNNFFSYSLKNKKSDIFSGDLNFENGIYGKIFSNQKEFLLNSSMIGKFNLYNILASVLTVQKITNFSTDEILKTLENFCGVGGRMEIIFAKKEEKKSLEIFTDYAHTPDAVENVLKSIFANNKKILTVVGCGGDRDKTKRPLMAKISCQNSEKVFLTSDNPRFESPEEILKDMEKGVEDKFLNFEIIEDRKKAIKKAIELAEEIYRGGENVTVAILGKGDENYLDIGGKKIFYSDEEEVLNFLKK